MLVPTAISVAARHEDCSSKMINTGRNERRGIKNREREGEECRRWRDGSLLEPTNGVKPTQEHRCWCLQSFILRKSSTEWEIIS